MTDPQTSPNEHAQFDNLCSSVEDYEPLPEVAPGPAGTTPALSQQEHVDSIDSEILAALVSP